METKDKKTMEKELKKDLRNPNTADNTDNYVFEQELF